MSFSDLSRRGSGNGSGSGAQQQQSGGFGSAAPVRSSASSSGDPLAQITESLQLYEKMSVKIKASVTDMRRRKVGLAEKQDLDAQIRNLKEVEGKLKNQLDALARQVEGLPRSEAAARRIGVGKLLKDFERVRALAQLQLNEVSLIKVASAAGDAAGGTGSVFRMGGAGGGGMGGMATSGRGGDFNPGEGESAPSPPSSSSAAAPRLMQTLQGQDVDEMIMEERERDIRKMNQDLLLVHEMFQDMANIVEQQGEMIEEIADMTEKSHGRAQAGLEQVKQAAAYQPSCTVC